MKPHLTHLFMEVSDMTAARRFWIDALGLELLDDRGAYIAVGGNGGFAIGIEQVPDGQVSADGPEITLRVDDVDATVARLRELGVQIETEPADQPWQARHAWLHDPDGRRMSIYSTDTPTMAMKSIEGPSGGARG
jgi:catechol 2,3-dioxygenase-like lactoylglutathione lyase family enzyme